jgi:hypothetical protein
MGLFRSWARKNQKKAAVKPSDKLPDVGATKEQIERRDLTAEARPDPDQPGWGRIVGQTISKAREGR